MDFAWPTSGRRNRLRRREAAEKRRAEQMRQRECALKADLDKVLPRDRTVYLNHCLDTLAVKQ